ncbi:hypothetical protein scyTo_0026459, partial [Scyliorhinus torazame]|nr:hypothetical protein [Scyliorhinus torazame]
VHPRSPRKQPSRYLLHQRWAVHLVLLLLCNGDPQDKGVNRTRDCRDEDNGRQLERESDEEREGKESLPAHTVTGLMGAGEVQAEIGEDLGSDEDPEGVWNHLLGDSIWEKAKPTQDKEDEMSSQSDCSHQEQGQLVAGVEHGTCQDDVTVEESRKYHQHQQSLVPLPTEVGLVQILQGLRDKGQSHEPGEA